MFGQIYSVCLWVWIFVYLWVHVFASFYVLLQLYIKQQPVFLCGEANA